LDNYIKPQGNGFNKTKAYTPLDISLMGMGSIKQRPTTPLDISLMFSIPIIQSLGQYVDTGFKVDNKISVRNTL